MGGEMPGVQVVFALRRDWLEAMLSGIGGRLEYVIDYWRRIADEVARAGAHRLLVIDCAQGEETLSREEFEQAHAAARSMPPDLRIAFVVRDTRLMAQIEYAALLGDERGMRVRLFDDRFAAERWLRYGGD